MEYLGNGMFIVYVKRGETLREEIINMSYVIMVEPHNDGAGTIIHLKHPGHSSGYSKILTEIPLKAFAKNLCAE